jgi:hypothetical protein
VDAGNQKTDHGQPGTVPKLRSNENGWINRFEIYLNFTMKDLLANINYYSAFFGIEV